jgi:hypothetical protein
MSVCRAPLQYSLNLPCQPEVLTTHSLAKYLRITLRTGAEVGTGSHLTPTETWVAIDWFAHSINFNRYSEATLRIRTWGMAFPDVSLACFLC